MTFTSRISQAVESCPGFVVAQPPVGEIQFEIVPRVRGKRGKTIFRAKAHQFEFAL